MNIDPVVLGILANFGWILTEIIAQSLADNIFTKFDAKKIQAKINLAIEQTLRDTVSDIPGFEFALDGEYILQFLESQVVIREFQKLLKPIEEPDIGILCDEWEKRFNNPIGGNTKILIELTITRLGKRLWEISELREDLHIRETHLRLKQLSDDSQAWAQIKTKVDDIYEIISEEGKADLTQEEEQLAYRLDICKDLLDNRRPNAALDILLELEKINRGKDISIHLRFRMTTLIGGCLYAIGEESNAIEYFDRAFKLEPDNPRAIANAALAAVLEAKWEKAKQLAQKALDISDKITSARAILTIAIANEQNFQDLEELVDDKFFNNHAYVHNLGIAFLRAKNYEYAERYFKLSLALDPSDIHSLLSLAQIIMDTQLSNVHKSDFLPKTIDQDWHDALDKSLQLVNTAINEASKGDNQFLVWQSQAARSSVLAIKGDLKAAKRDCDEILDDNPDFPLAIHNRASFATIELDYHLAIELFEKLSKEKQLHESVIFSLCRAYIGVERIEDADKLIQEYLDSDGNAKDLRVQAMQSWIYHKKGKSDCVNEILESLKGEDRTVYSLLAASEIEEIRANTEGAVCLLEEAYNIAPEDEKDAIGLRIAFLCYENREFECSAKWFKRINIDIVRDRYLARAYIQSMYSVRDYESAYKTAQVVRKSGIIDPALMEIESWLAEYLGDLETALDIERELVNIQPQNISHFVQLARLLFRKGDRKNAIQTLDSFDKDEIKDPYDLMQVAEIYCFMGKLRIGIHFAYHARRIGLDDPNIHLAYLSLFLRASDSLDDLEPEVVYPNTAVKLTSENSSSRWITIISLFPPEEKNWEFSPDSAQGKRLIGKKLGDSVVYRESDFEELSFSIDSIQSIYLRAHQNIYEEFSTRFPDHLGLQEMKVRNGDLTKFFTFAFRRSNIAKSAHEFYRAGYISIEQFANLVGRSQVDVFSSIIGNRKKRIFACIGSQEDQSTQKSIISNTQEITITLSGLLTLAYLDILDILNQRFSKVFISQRFLDELERVLADRYFELRNGRTTIGYVDGKPKPVIEELAPEIIQQNVDFIENLRDHSTSNFEVIPIPPELSNHLILPEDPRKNIGQVSISSILVAKSTNSILYADDMRLRKFAKEILQVDGFWTQILLQDFVDEGLISFSDYAFACTKLLDTNYHFTSLNPDLIMQVIDDSKYLISSNVRTIVTGLKGPEMIFEDAIRIASEVIRKYWLGPTMDENRRLLLDEILRNLCEGRNMRQIVRALMKELEGALLVAPIQQQSVLQEIDNWYKVHLRLT
jgi:tetratricopeptide (TPR) repeat protein